MDDLITGLVGVILITIFLGFYLVGIKSVPFGIIVIGIFVLILVEFVEGIKKSKDEAKE